MSIFSYRKFGEGSEVWFCFHGFGQDSEVFKDLESPVRTIYSFDLFFHRKDHGILNGHAVTPQKWQQFLSDFIKEKHITKIRLMAFSMGGRVALMTAQLLPHYVHEVVLLAPDGIYTHWWFRLATQYSWGKKAFQHLLANYPLLHTSLVLGNKLGLVSTATLKLVKGQIGSRQKRDRLFNGWQAHREFVFSLNNLANSLNQNQIPLKLFTGKYDSIFPAKVYRSFLNMLDQHRLIELPCGHYWLIQYFLRKYLPNHPEVIRGTSIKLD